jgi:hypothetical protein
MAIPCQLRNVNVNYGNCNIWIDKGLQLEETDGEIHNDENVANTYIKAWDGSDNTVTSWNSRCWIAVMEFNARC